MIEAAENHDAAKALIEAFGFDDAVRFIDKAREQAREEFERRPDLDRVSVPIAKGDEDGGNQRRIAILSFSRR